MYDYCENNELENKSDDSEVIPDIGNENWFYRVMCESSIEELQEQWIWKEKI